MKRFIAAALLSSTIALAPSAVSAQSPPVEAPAATLAPAVSPAVVDETTADEEGGRPWWRLAIFIPASAALGAAVVLGRRAARDRGWVRA